MTHEEINRITVAWGHARARLEKLAHTSGVKPKDLAFTRKAPCNNCPFRQSTPAEDGIASNLPSVIFSLEMGRFGHTCHKSDPRAHGYIEGYKGEVEHCAGAIIMLLKTKDGDVCAQDHIVDAVEDGRLDLADFDPNDPDVCTPDELLDKYHAYLVERIESHYRRERAAVTGATYL